MRLKTTYRSYAREDIEGKELVHVSFNLMNKSYQSFDYKAMTDITDIQVTLVTDKSIKVIGGGYERRSYKDLGVLNYGGVYVLKSDAEAVVQEYWESLRAVMKWELEKKVNQIKAIQQHLGLVGEDNGIRI